MSIVKIDYDRLETISSSAKKTASEMQDYMDDLTRKVSNKYSDITGGASAKTNNSSYYVNQKINQLKSKKTHYSTFATTVSTFLTNAQDIDRDVARKITISKNDFIDKHDYIDVNWWTELKEFLVELKNSCPLFNVIGNLIESTIEGVKNICADIKYWYKCGGGKEKIGCLLAIAGAVAAIVLAIVAFPVSTLVGFFAAIGAVIAAVNAVVNVVTSFRAKKAKDDGDPAWAKIYSGQDTAQDVLRQTNFKDRTLNKISYGVATTIDATQTVCDVVAVVDGVKNIKKTYKEIKRYSQRSRTRNFRQVFVSYVKNEKNYKGLKLGDYIRERVKPRSFKGDLKKTIGRFNAVVNFADKLNMGETSIKSLVKNGGKMWSKSTNLKTPGLVYKTYDVYKKDIKGIIKDYKGLVGA